MAIAFRAAGAVATSSANVATPALPTGHTTNDILILLAVSLDNVTHTVVTGYTQIGTQTNNGTGLTTSVWYKRDNGTEVAPAVHNVGGGNMIAVLVAYSGCRTTGSPIDTNSAWSANSSSTTATATGLTTGFSACQLIEVFGDDTKQASWLTPSGSPTPLVRVSGPNTTSFPSLALCDSSITTGLTTTGGRTITMAAAHLNNGMQISLVPASAQASRTVTETLSAVTNSPTRVPHFARGPADSVTAVSDSTTRAWTGGRGPTDSTAAPVDTPARNTIQSRGPSDSTPAPSDLIVRLLSFFRGEAETIPAPTDAATRNAARARAVTETVVAVSDAIARALMQARTGAESVPAVVDALARAQVVARAIAEAIAAPTDAATGLRNLLRVIAETLSAVSDSSSRVFAAMRTVAEALMAVADAATRPVIFARSVDPTKPFFSTVVFQQSHMQNNDWFSYSDGINPALTWEYQVDNLFVPTAGRIVLDIRTPAPSPPLPPPAPLDAEQVLVITLASIQSQHGAGFQITALGQGQALSSMLFLFNDNSNTVGNTAVSGFFANGGAPSGAFSGGVDLAPSDSAARSEAAARNAPESIAALVDAVARALAGGRSVGEATAAPVDAVSTIRALLRALVETLSAPADDPSRAVGAGRSINENVPAPTDGIFGGLPLGALLLVAAVLPALLLAAELAAVIVAQSDVAGAEKADQSIDGDVKFVAAVSGAIVLRAEIQRSV